MRSLSAWGASETNKSGGIQGMSRWQSAEILLYCMAPSEICSVQPQIDDVLGVGLELAALDPLDDIDQRGIGARRQPDLLALADDETVEELDLGAPALDHVLAHRRALAARALLRIGEPARIDLLQRRLVALAGARDHLGRQMEDLLERVAVRLADADRLAAKAGREPPQRVVVDHLAARQAGAGRHAVLHRVGDQLRPALAPQIFRHLGAVGVADQPADLLGPLGDAAMHLADPEHRVVGAAAAGAAPDMAGLAQL